jgi:hypothetical protein
MMLVRLGGLREVAERARARGYLVTDHGDRVGLLGGKPGAAVAGDVVWSKAQAVVLLRCAVGARVTAAHREALIAAVAALNAVRAVPGFVVRDSGIFFENHVLIEPDGAISRITFDRSLDMVFDAMTEHGPRLRAVAEGRPDAGATSP